MKSLKITLTFMFLLGITFSSYAIGSFEGIQYGNSWGQKFITDYKPNLVNLWSTHPFQKVTGLPGTWTYWQSSDGYWAQWFTTGAYGVSNITATQWWVDPKPGTLYLDWQECHYDWANKTVVKSWSGGLKGYWSVVAYGNAGGPDYCPGPVPEPSTMLLLGAGLFGFGVISRIRRNKKA